MSEDALMAAFDFTAEDLSYNRQGQLSASQKNKLSRNTTRSRLLLVVGGLFWTAVGVGVLWPFITQMSLDAAPLGRAIGGGVALLIAILVFLSIFDKPNTGVVQVDGRVQFITRDTSTHVDDQVISSTGYYILVGEKEFSASPAQMGALTQGDVYRFYYSEGTGLGILSMEYVGPGN